MLPHIDFVVGWLSRIWLPAIGNPDQPGAKVLFEEPAWPSEWRGIQPGVSSVEQVAKALALMPEGDQGSIVIDRYRFNEGTYQQELEKNLFQLLAGCMSSSFVE